MKPFSMHAQLHYKNTNITVSTLFKTRVNHKDTITLSFVYPIHMPLFFIPNSPTGVLVAAAVLSFVFR